MNYAMFLDSYTDWPGTKPTSIGNRTSQIGGLWDPSLRIWRSGA